jgi:hypothetical protein
MSRKTIATIAVSAVLVLSAGTAAFAASASGDSTPTAAGSGSKPAATAQRCERAPTALGRLTTAKGLIADRITTLTTAKATAEQSGHSRLASRIGARIERLNGRLTTIEGRIVKLQGWTTSHCSPTPATSTPATSTPSTGAPTPTAAG